MRMFIKHRVGESHTNKVDEKRLFNRIIFMVGWGIIATLLLIMQIGCQSNEEPAAKNVLIITIDTVRADALSCYNLPPLAAKTRHLDQLAEAGTLFQRAACQIPATLTSHTAIFSGRMPRSTGVRYAKDRVPKNLETLADIFHDNGYSTAAFVSAAVLNRIYGLDLGFDVYNDVSDLAGEEAERSAEVTTDQAIEWLQNRDKKKTFLFMGPLLRCPFSLSSQERIRSLRPGRL